MQERMEKVYTVRPLDFVPFVGSFIYQERNWKDKEGRFGEPMPYGKYCAIGLGLY